MGSEALRKSWGRQEIGRLTQNGFTSKLLQCSAIWGSREHAELRVLKPISYKSNLKPFVFVGESDLTYKRHCKCIHLYGRMTIKIITLTSNHSTKDVLAAPLSWNLRVKEWQVLQCAHWLTTEKNAEQVSHKQILSLSLTSRTAQLTAKYKIQLRNKRNTTQAIKITQQIKTPLTKNKSGALFKMKQFPELQKQQRVHTWRHSQQ